MSFAHNYTFRHIAAAAHVVLKVMAKLRQLFSLQRAFWKAEIYFHFCSITEHLQEMALRGQLGGASDDVRMPRTETVNSKEQTVV